MPASDSNSAKQSVSVSWELWWEVDCSERRWGAPWRERHWGLKCVLYWDESWWDWAKGL